MIEIPFWFCRLNLVIVIHDSEILFVFQIVYIQRFSQYSCWFPECLQDNESTECRGTYSSSQHKIVK